MKKLLTIMAVLGLMLWAAGCSNQAVEPANTDGLNLTDEFGGYTTAAEKPAFGDTQLADEESGEQEINDPILASPSADSVIADPEAGVFHLRAVWGRLELDTTVTEQTDWSGSLTISRGAEVVRRLIRFEDGQDYLLERTSRDLIEWVSITTVHNDGIAVDLYVPPPRPILDTTITTDSLGNDIITVDTLWPDPVTVSFATGPYSRTFTLAELAALDTVVELEDGNAVALHAMRISRIQCRRGFLYGFWGPDEETGETGFKGMFTDQHGQITGFVSGHVGVNDNGERVWFGKWITRNGNFEGFLRGSWAPHPDRHANSMAHRHAGGWFRGGIYDANRTRIGELRGRYGNGDNMRGGFFQARWRLNCLQPENGDMDDPFANLDDGF